MPFFINPVNNYPNVDSMQNYKSPYLRELIEIAREK